MKKVFLTVSLALGALCVAVAQEKEQKDPASYLPAKGDFAVQVSANPFLQFVGNMFNGTTNQGTPTFGNTYKISGKYFLTDKSALRVGLGFNFDKESYKTSVVDIEATTADPNLLTDPETVPYVNDVEYSNTSLFDFSIGYEMRRGTGRLQFLYGGELLFNYLSSSDSYKYGNPITKNNQVASRSLKVSQGGSFGVGLGAFIGGEYFIIPKVSIGAELGLGFLYQIPTKAFTETEGWDATKEEVKTQTLKGFNNSYGDINFSTKGSAAINVTLYF